MPKKNASAPEVENPVENVENTPEQTEPIEPEANQTEPEAKPYVSPDELIAAFVKSPEFSDTMKVINEKSDKINEKLDKIDTIIRGIINRNDPPAEEKQPEHPQHIRRYL